MPALLADVDSVTQPLTPETVRRWLGRLGAPDKLGRDPQLVGLLRANGRVDEAAGPLVVGRSGAKLLREAIERLRPAAPSSRQESLPYEVAKVCFVDDVPLAAAADRLGMSPRQLTRERARVVAMLVDEIASAGAPTPVAAPAPVPPLPVPSLPAPAAPTEPSEPALPPGSEPGRGYGFEPIPAIAGFLSRPQVAAVVTTALAERRLVHVHGPAGGGKTSLVADLASVWAQGTPVLWYRVRPGVNDSLPAVLFEIGQHLGEHGRPRLAETMSAALPSIDASLVSRVAVQELSGHAMTLVLDDYHVVTGRPGVAAFLEDVVARLPDVRLVTIGRADQPRLHDAVDVEVPPLTPAETQALLRRLGDRDADAHVDLVHHWTHGVPYLVQLAASWLVTADPEEIRAGGYEFSEQTEVQVFLLDALTGLMDSVDRIVLDAASVFRTRFTDPALAYVAGRTVGQVADTSRRLVGAHLASRSRQGGIALFCEVLREHIYQRLDPDRRVALHQRASEWYRSLSDTDEADYHAARAR